MDHPQYRFDLVTADGQFVGFNLWWNFSDVRYIEHLATFPRLRGKGYGQRILRDFFSASDVPVLLEVEPPTDDVSKRRIGFYQRTGFVLNAHPYTHPPYKKGGAHVPLMLMTYPAPLTDSELACFLEQHHPVIHKFVLSP